MGVRALSGGSLVIPTKDSGILINVIIRPYSFPAWNLLPIALTSNLHSPLEPQAPRGVSPRKTLASLRDLSCPGWADSSKFEWLVFWLAYVPVHDVLVTVMVTGSPYLIHTAHQAPQPLFLSATYEVGSLISQMKKLRHRV